MAIWNQSLVEKFELIGRESLRPTLIERDAAATFSDTHWVQMTENALFSMGREGRKLDLTMPASAFYGLAKGSLDIPLTCTMAAHGVIARDLLLQFGRDPQVERYLSDIESGRVRAAICNSETGAGTNLRKLKSECRIDPEGHAHLKFNKPCVTNGFGSLFFVSAWHKELGADPSISVYIVEKNEVESSDLARDLSAFRTGVTGSVRADISGFPAKERRLQGSAFGVFKHCFNLERLFIGVIIAGALHGIEEETRAMLADRGRSAGKPVEEQWLQEKLIRVTSARIKISSLVERVLSQTSGNLDASGPELSVLKMMVNEDAFDAAMAYFETVGHRAINANNVAQKLLRDLTAMRFFGGTTELQKISLYTELMAPLAAPKLSALKGA